MMDTSKSPMFSRTSIGRDRWYWVVVEEWGEEPIAKGIAGSPEGALAEAERQYGPVHHKPGTLARGFWKKHQSLKRQRSVAQADDAQPLEFAYRCYRDYSEWDGGAYEVIERHRIVKRTKKRVYVEDEPYDGRRPPSGEWWDYDQPTFILDRRVFETTGKADRSRKGWWTYYADPDLYHVERGRMARPACFEALDLPSDASMAQIKAAYHRLSRATHPDAGGADCDFVRLTRNYEKAMLLAAGQE